jgi:hypothetical protein
MINKRKAKKILIKSNTLRIASSISKIKVRYNYPPSIGDYKEPFNENKMRLKINEILKSFSSYNDKSKLTAAKLIKEENLKNAKENIIISLREDLKYHKKVNRDYLLYKQYATDILNYYKQNYEEITKYKMDLRTDLQDFITVVERFEDQIKQYNKEREMMIKTNNDIIKYKNQEKEKLNARINVLNNDLEKQKIKLDSINETFNDYQTQNENYIEKLNKSELNFLEQFEDLESKYKRLKAQYEMYFNMEMKRRKNELDLRDDNLCREEKDMADLKLQDKIVHNNFLKEMVEEIKSQIKEIEDMNKRSEEEEQMIRFLGKAFYNKVKQRREEKANNTNIENTKESLYENKNRSNTCLKTDKSGENIKNKRSNKLMKKKPGLNLFISKSQNFFKNKNRHNILNTFSSIGNNVNKYGNNLIFYFIIKINLLN